MRLGTDLIMRAAPAGLAANSWSTERGGVYVAFDDVDAHFARATAAGAEIVRPLADTGYCSREFTARDCDGHLWSFGTYRPEPART